MADLNPTGLDELRALLAAIGIHPGDAELTGALPVVASLQEGAQQLAHLLMLQHEPATTFRLPDPAPGAATP